MNMGKRLQDKDIEQIIEGNITDKELKELNAALKNYMKSRNLNAKSTADQVDLVLILFAILDVPEDRFMDFISRLNVLQLKRLGVTESTNSGIVH